MESGLRVRLKREERQALDQFRAARERFDQILSEVPSGIPQPDGNLRIHRAGRELRYFNRRSNRGLQTPAELHCSWSDTGRLPG